MQVNFISAIIGAILGVACVFLLVTCGPKKEEGSPVAQAKEEQPQSAPPVVIPPAPQTPEQKHEEGHLTPQQKEELEINEDDVMNPFPG